MMMLIIMIIQLYRYISFSPEHIQSMFEAICRCSGAGCAIDTWFYRCGVSLLCTGQKKKSFTGLPISFHVELWVLGVETELSNDTLTFESRFFGDLLVAGCLGPGCLGQAILRQGDSPKNPLKCVTFSWEFRWISFFKLWSFPSGYTWPLTGWCHRVPLLDVRSTILWAALDSVEDGNPAGIGHGLWSLCGVSSSDA